MKRIVYIGSKPQKGDNVAQTGLVWTRGQIHAVEDDKKAAILLQHSRVWADADTSYELMPEIALVQTPEPRVNFIPDSAQGPFWEPVSVLVPAEIFKKLQAKEIIPVFMSEADADGYAAWKKLDAETAPKKTGPKVQDKETKAGLESRKVA